jgi:hypothetical protein
MEGLLSSFPYLRDPYAASLSQGLYEARYLASILLDPNRPRIRRTHNIPYKI